MSQSRQLAAIMFTDIVGYTSLMGEDEHKAFELLNKNRQLQKPIIKQHNGKWIKELGDGVLASFNTATDAVHCALEMQQACHAVPALQLRIGIHLGDVVFENEDVFGDGVNIAARLQAIAPINGIWISETVHTNIANKREINSRFVKVETLKHVKEPVRIYEVDATSEKPKIDAERKESNVRKKSVAVLPFINMSSDPEQEYFSDGLTEEIITDLSRLEKLLVISRNSMMTFKGTYKKTKEVANEVNAQYILEGSVRKAGNSLRITAQLIDAHNDAHLWAEKYTGTMDDVFEIQEKVSRAIVYALNVKLTGDEDSFLSKHPVQNTKAYEYYILARQAMWTRTEQRLDDAITYAQRGLDLTGDNAYLYAIMGSAYLYFSFFAIRSDPSYESKACEYATKSLALEPACAQGYLTLGIIEYKKGNIQEAATIFKKMLQLDHGNTDAMVWLMVCYIVVGRPEAALPISERLIQVDPLSIYGYQMVGDITFYSGNFKDSLPHFRWWLQKDSESPFVRFLCAWNFAMNNELQESFDVLDAIIRDTPTLIYAKVALFLKAALQGSKDQALTYATQEMKGEAALLGLAFPVVIAWGYALIDEKDKAVWWLNKYLSFGYSPYPLMLNWETFNQVLRDHKGFQEYMDEIKKRSELFVV